LNSSFFLVLPFYALLAAPTPPPILTLRDGRTFHLQAPARIESGRVVFTTTDGKTYSLDPADVKSEVDRPPTPTRPPNYYNPQDSKNLGAIARQERASTGKTSDLSAAHPTPHATAKRTPRPHPTAAPRKTARPTRTPTPTPH